MTAQKVLDIGKAGAGLTWKLAVFISMSVFVIVAGFFKLWAFLGDGNDEKGMGQSEEYWDMENPNAGSCEKAEAFSKGEWG